MGTWAHRSKAFKNVNYVENLQVHSTKGDYPKPATER